LAYSNPEHEMAIFSSFNIAERTGGSCWSLAFLRWALVIVFLWFGGMKFTSYEAHGNAPLIDHSPIMSWMNVAFGIQGASDLIGTIELATAAVLIAGAFLPLASALGAAMSTVTFLITLSFFVSTPGVAEPTAGGFPAISAPIGQFLLKDLVLLAASINLLLPSIRAVSNRARPSFNMMPRVGRLPEAN
jgi:reactive chlorine resistance protein C